LSQENKDGSLLQQGTNVAMPLQVLSPVLYLSKELCILMNNMNASRNSCVSRSSEYLDTHHIDI